MNTKAEALPPHSTPSAGTQRLSLQIPEFRFGWTGWLAIALSVGADVWYWYSNKEVADYYRRLASAEESLPQGR